MSINLFNPVDVVPNITSPYKPLESEDNIAFLPANISVDGPPQPFVTPLVVVFLPNYGNGIYLQSSLDNTVTGNNIQDIKNYDVYLSSCSNNFISENTLSGNNGIYLTNSLENIISGNNITNTDNNGIYLNASPDNTLILNNVTDNSNYGIYINNSPVNTLQNNLFDDNAYNFGICGTNLSDYTQYIDESNTINGNSMYYIMGQNNLVFNGIAMGYLALISCNNITINNITLMGNDMGYYLLIL